MKKRLLFLLSLITAPFANTLHAQTATELCRAAKIQSLSRQQSNPRARVAYPGDNAIDVTYYGLDLRLTHTPNYLRGAATVRLKSLTASLTNFFLDCNPQLTVDSVVSNGRRLVFVRGTNRVTIAPPQPLSVGQALALTVYYQGNPASQSGFGSFAFSEHGPKSDPVIWSLSEPYGASDWFPNKDTPADKADSSSVSITADKQFVSVSNGILLSTTDNADGTRTYRWRNSYPIAPYLISLAMTNYERYDTPFTYQDQTMPVTHYIYPETLPSIKANLDRTPDMLRVFSGLFGPYPFLREKYGHAQFGWGGGMEHQTISSMGAWSTSIIAHELTHQWFGDKITCRDWQNIWLNEGFASYGEALYAEATTGPAAYTATMNNFLARARNARGSLYVQDISNVNSIFDGNRTYAKGASVLHMLRGVLGDDVFFNSLRTYATAPGVTYSTAVTDDFRTVVERVSGKDLTYFFQQWVFGEGYPAYKATVTNASASNVTVRLEQRNATASNPASFTMPVQVLVKSAAGDTTVTVLNNRADQTFTLPARGVVTDVVVDPSNWILAAKEPTVLNIVTALPEPVDPTLSVYPNPTAGQLTVAFTVTKPGLITVSLLNMLGQRVQTLPGERLIAGWYQRIIPLRGLSAGQYVLHVDGETGSQRTTVLVR